MGSQSVLRGLAFISLLAVKVVFAATLTVSTTGGNASSPLLYGLMFEVCLPIQVHPQAN
jgi:alpha-N-arabinofuranosidase